MSSVAQTEMTTMIQEITNELYKKIDRGLMFALLPCSTVSGLTTHFPELFEGDESRLPPDGSIRAPQWMRDKVNKAYDEGKI